MTTFRLFIHRRDSVRWLVLAMAVGSIALAMAALACAPAAPASPGAGETAANAAVSARETVPNRSAFPSNRLTNPPRNRPSARPGSTPRPTNP